MTFESHGYFEVVMHPRLMLVSCGGVWNLEKAHELNDALRQLVEPLDGKSFNAIVTLQPDTGATPDALRVCAEMTGWLIENGLSKEAFVCTSSLQYYMVEEIVLANYINKHNIRTFDSLDKATEWLNKKPA